MSSQETTTNHPIPIPIELWESSKKKKKKKTKNKKSLGVYIRHFTYNLNDEKFVNCNIQQVSNLFFEYSSITNENVSNDYIIIQMDDTDNNEDRLDGNKNDDRGSSRTIIRDFFSYQVDNRRENILRYGICGFEDGEEEVANTGSLVYNLIGCSNSQVQRHHYVFRKSRSLQGNETHLQHLLPNLKELEVKKGAPKRVKYTGLLFSGIDPVQLPEGVIVEEIESKVKNGFDFTDGPGIISHKLAMWVKDQLDIQGECPSVFQIRYCGRVSRLHDKNMSGGGNSNIKKNGFVCKGILVVNPEDDSLRIQVRSSMLKVESSARACDVLQRTLGICGYSRGPLVGRLGSQLVCLLSHAMKNDDLLQLQNEYLDNLKNSIHDPISMAWVMALDTQRQNWKDFNNILLEDKMKEEVNNNNSNQIPKQYIQCTKAVKCGRHLPKSDKVQIPLAASRTLFGAVLPEYLHETLNENECIVLLEDGPLSGTRINQKNNGENADADAFVVVSRSPAYYPGDIRVLKVVTPSPGSPVAKLKNCILFSTQGDRPEPDKMGGGDLDGDMYLVIWHPTILKYAKTLKEVPPTEYDVTPPKGQQSTIKHDWVHYAALTDNNMLAEVENAFYKIAKKYGVRSTELKQMNGLFASLVDRNPTSLEEFRKMKNSVATVDNLSVNDECIWEVMTERQRVVINSLKKRSVEKSQKFTSYVKFQRKLHSYIENPSVFTERIQQQFWYHFLNSPRRKDIENTIKSWEQQRCNKQMLGNSSITEPIVTDRPSNIDLTIMTKEVTQEEKIYFEKIQARAEKLFEKPFSEVEKCKRSLEEVLAEQLSRMIAIISSRESEIGSLHNMIRAKDTEKERILHSLNLSLERHRARFEPQISTLKSELELLKTSILERSAEYESAKSEFDSQWFWYMMGMFSDRKQQLSARILELKGEVELVKKQCDNIRRQILDKEIEFANVKNTWDYDAKQEEVEKKRHILETKVARSELIFKELLDGTEKKRLESLREDISQKVDFLQQEQDELDGRIAEKQKELTQSEKCKNEFEDKNVGVDSCRCCGKQLLQQIEAMIFSSTLHESNDYIAEQVNKLGGKLLECVSRLLDMEPPEISLIDKLSKTRRLLAGKTRSILIKTFNLHITTFDLLAAQSNDDVDNFHYAFLRALDDCTNSLCVFEKDCIADRVLFFRKELELLKTKRNEYCRKVDESRKELCILNEKINSMFCPETFTDANEKFVDTKEKQESLIIGHGRIQRNIQQFRQRWARDVQNVFLNYDQRKTDWKSLQEDLERVYSLEENRLLGVPREGKKRNGPLPVYFKRAELERLMDTSRAVVVTAGTGTGKSTQLPQYIADYYLDRSKSEGTAKPIRICCTQPRRVAAQNIAKRVAAEYQTKVGHLVGFRVGSRGLSQSESKQVSQETVIEFVTEGLLLFNLAKSGDFVKSYDCIIIDEMHERNAEQDLCLALLRDYLLQSVSSHPSFKVVIMSATIDSSQFCRYFNDCPSMNCHGKNFEVKEEYIPLSLSPTSEEEKSSIISHVIDVLFNEIVGKSEFVAGDVLVFLSGSKEINECVNAIRARASESGSLVLAYPLYSKLDQESIDAATNPDHRTGLCGEVKQLTKKISSISSYVQKVICATNIAETSLTIDRVKFVIDSGRVRKVSYNHNFKCSTLNNEWASKASTKQRRGRAGRTGPGQCYYLFSQEFHRNEMADYDKPKILEKPVDELILFSLNLCGKSIEEIGLLDVPEKEDILAAKERLLDLDMIEMENKDGVISLTESGKVASSLGFLKPESVRMILNACAKYPQCVPRVIKLAVVMSSLIDGRFDGNLGTEEDATQYHVYGDHLRVLNNLDWFEDHLKNTKCNKNRSLEAFKAMCHDRGLDFSLFKGILDDVDNCHKELKRRGLLQTPAERIVGEDESVLRALISGYFHHIVECLDPDFIHKTKCTLLTDHGIQLSLDRESCLQDSFVSQNEIILDDEDTQLLDNDNPNLLNDDLQQIQSVLKEAVDPSYLIYGGLSCFLSPSGRLNLFMQDCSVIEGSWIREVAPARWLARVQSAIEKCCLCRITIKNIGAMVLKDCSKSKLKKEDSMKNKEDNINFFELVKRDSKADSILYDYNHCFVRITGTQTAVEAAKTSICKELDAVIQKKCRDISNNVRTKIYDVEKEFESGMRIRRGNNNNLRCSKNNGLRAFGINKVTCYPNSGIISPKVLKNKREVVIYLKHLWPSKLIKHCLEDISDLKFRKVTIANEDISDLKFRKVTIANQSLLVDFKPNEILGDGAAWIDAANYVVSRLARHEVFATDCHSVEALQSNGIMLGALCHEAVMKSHFWKGFRDTLFSGHNMQADVIFVPSQKSFIIAGPDRKRLSKKFKYKIEALSKHVKNYVVPEFPSERYQLRRFASIFGEIKARFQDVMFCLQVETQTNDLVGHEFDLSFLSEYTWLMDITSRLKVVSIRIRFVDLHTKTQNKVSKDLDTMLNSRAFLEERISTIDIKDSRDVEVKKCVMCRRLVLISFGKGCGGTKKELANREQDLILGRTLTICGCAYCGECFRNGASQCLSSSLYGHTVKCFNCKKTILANDCRAMFLLDRNSKGNDFTKWNQFCRLAEASYCANNIQMLAGKRGTVTSRQSGYHVCPDCGIAMVFPRGYKFFQCRSTFCPNSFCTRCRQVVVSDDSAKKCSRDECVQYNN